MWQMNLLHAWRNQKVRELEEAFYAKHGRGPVVEG